MDNNRSSDIAGRNVCDLRIKYKTEKSDFLKLKSGIPIE